jgi:hypothetical protein
MQVRIPRNRLVLTVVATVALASSSAPAATFGVDGRNGFNGERVLATGGKFELFRATIEGEGHTIVVLTSFTSADLDGLDAIILAQPSIGDASSDEYSGAELAAIHAFVAAGGGLLAHGEGGGFSNQSVSNLNALVAPYGVTYGGAATAGGGLLVPPSAFRTPHKLTVAIDDPIGLDFVRPLETIGPPAQNLFEGDDELEQFMAFVEHEPAGRGAVVMLSDQSMWTDPGEGSDTDLMHFYPDSGPPLPVDNQQLLRNILMFITPAPPVPGDVNGDGRVDEMDLLNLFKDWGLCPAPPEECPSDLNGDGVVDAMDLLYLLGLW